jgi:hypothetical protein
LPGGAGDALTQHRKLTDQRDHGEPQRDGSPRRQVRLCDADDEVLRAPDEREETESTGDEDPPPSHPRSSITRSAVRRASPASVRDGCLSSEVGMRDASAR